MAADLPMSPQLEQIHGEIRDNFRALAYVLISLFLSHSLSYCNVRAIAMVFLSLNLCDLACML